MIDQVGYNKQLLQENGILFDAELDENTNTKRLNLYGPID